MKDVTIERTWTDHTGVRVLHYATYALSGADDPRALAAATAGSAVSALGAGCAARVRLSGVGGPDVTAEAGAPWPRLGPLHAARRHAAARTGRAASLAVPEIAGWAVGVFPLVSGEESVGVLEVLASDRALAGAWDVVEVLAAQAAVALSNLRRQAWLRQQVSSLRSMPETDGGDGPGEPAEARRRVLELATRLTPREREILRLLSQGAATREIASRLHIAPNTVRSHVQALLSKLQVHTRLGAVAFATRNGLLHDGPALAGTAARTDLESA